MATQAAGLGVTPTYGAHAASLLPAGGYVSDLDTSEPEDVTVAQSIGRRRGDGARGPAASVPRVHTLFAWRDPVSPHVAVATEGAQHVAELSLKKVSAVLCVFA